MSAPANNTEAAQSTSTPAQADSSNPNTGTSPAAPASAAATTEQPQPQEVSTSDAAAKPELTSTSTKEQAETLIAEGKKAIALKQWEEGVAKYADALDIMRSLVGDQDPAMAPLLLSYGKALFELAFSQAGVMGKEEVEREMQREESEGGPSTLVESADPELLENGETAADNEAEAADVPEDEAEGSGAQDEGGAEDEPEDDYNAAWEVVDVARTIYLRVIEQGKKEGKDGEKVKEVELRLAECYETLGDISCETENFSQAASDYTSALSLLTPYHPPSSRTLAGLHFQLGVALEFLPQRRADALSHVQSALTAFKTRLSELSLPTEQMTNPDLAKLSPKDREAESKEVSELIGDLEVKVEELKTAPEGEGLVEEGIRHLVGGPSAADVFASGSGPGASGSGSGNGVKKEDGPVNDLSGMVKKKKKPVAAAATSASAAATSVKTEATTLAQNVKEAVVHAAENAAEIVEANVTGGVSAGNGSGKREAEVEVDEAGLEGDRGSKRTKIDA